MEITIWCRKLIFSPKGVSAHVRIMRIALHEDASQLRSRDKNDENMTLKEMEEHLAREVSDRIHDEPDFLKNDV